MSPELEKQQRGPIGWMATNPVAANLLMLILVIGGFISVIKMKQQVFPTIDLDILSVSCVYPGADPAEVEQGVLLLVEEAVRGIDGVKEVTATANDGVGSVLIELQKDANSSKVLNDVKNEVDRITNFPDAMEAPSVSLLSTKENVIGVIISGDEDLAVLHSIGEKVRSDLLATTTISQVEITGTRPLEIAIEISRQNLEAYGLTLNQVAAAIKASSLDLPAGSMDTKGGTVMVRLKDRRLKGEEFENLVIRGAAGHGEVRLGDIATITDGYADTDNEYLFNGKRAIVITAYSVGKETPLKVAARVRKYVKKIRGIYPDNVKFTIWNDYSVVLKGRMQLLVTNAIQGLILVIIALSMFLQKRLAMWVALGIPVSFLGTFLMMPGLGGTINMVTLFAFIITLGMVVDDAIIIAENVYHKMNKGIPPLQAAIEGAKEMAMPVTFSILTTVAAFIPLLMMPGIMGKVFYSIPVVVILVLLFSWVESFFILPAHLAHGIHKKGKFDFLTSWIDRLQESSNAKLKWFIENKYEPALRYILHHRYVFIALAFAGLIMVVGTVPAGLIKFTFMPKIDGDLVGATVRLRSGVGIEETQKVAEKIQIAARKTLDSLDTGHLSKGIFVRIGESGVGGGPVSGTMTSSNLLSVQIDLGESAKRDFGSQQFANAWKKRLPEFPNVESFSLKTMHGPDAGKDVDFKLVGSDQEELALASKWLAHKLSDYNELTDIENSFTAGVPQLDFSLKPGASELGITSATVANALRSALYGAEATREQRGRNELRVMVRLPKSQRVSEYDIENFLIPTAKGTMVPISSVATLKRGVAPTQITRDNGSRMIEVSADVLPGGHSGDEMMTILTGAPKSPIAKFKAKRAAEKAARRGEKIQPSLIQEMYAKFPGIRWVTGGQQKEMHESMGSLIPNFFMALLVIYTLLAVPFKSYVQPIIVMTAIPFGIVGAIIGHLLLGYNLSIMSMLGIIALSGVVVNDSLVLVDASNKYRARGMTVTESLVTAGKRRFRPILLTSITTFFGLMPLMFSRSMQARFLIPMAISLGFGILFVTVIVLLIIPALYIWLERILCRLGFVDEKDI